MDKMKIEITENQLKNLLTAYHYYNILERDGVDNWGWYMQSYKEYCEEDGCEDLDELIYKQLQKFKEGKNAEEIL